MTVHQTKSKINLLPQKGLVTTTGGRVLLWILTSFRIIVIFTEIIVMAAFLSRFWLDAKNTDLSEEISHKKDVLIASSDFEKEFKHVQKRLEVLSELSKNDRLATRSLKSIRTSLPPDIFLNGVSFSENKFNLTGMSPNEKSIQQLVVNLENKENLENVSLTSINSEKNNPDLLEFELLVSTK